MVITGRPLRFWERVEKTDDCWLWSGKLTKDGYGAMFARGEHGAHRVAWLLVRGPIPNGMTLDHLCRNRACVNPDHLEPVTNRENVLRGFGAPAVYARQTQCLNGHVWDEANTHWYRGYRVCRACHAAFGRRKRAAIRGETFDRW